MYGCGATTGSVYTFVTVTAFWFLLLFTRKVQKQHTHTYTHTKTGKHTAQIELNYFAAKHTCLNIVASLHKGKHNANNIAAQINPRVAVNTYGGNSMELRRVCKC